MSDIHYMINDWNMPKMSECGVRCAGHEGAGVVVKVGAKCPSSWKVGDRVGIKPLLDVCHNCEMCWNGRENYCSKAVYTGAQVPGTWERVDVKRRLADVTRHVPAIRGVTSNLYVTHPGWSTR